MTDSKPSPGPSPETLRVFDPPMCCSTGVCGPDVDPELVRFAADVRWLEGRGVRVERHNLSHEPEAFARSPQVAAAFRRRSIAALPVVLVGERPLREGAYPSRAELAASLGLAADAPAGDAPAPDAPTSCALGLHP